MLNASFLIAYLCIFLVSVSVSLFRSQEAKIKWTSGAAIPFASNQNSLHGMYVSMGWITAEKKPGKKQFC